MASMGMRGGDVDVPYGVKNKKFQAPQAASAPALDFAPITGPAASVADPIASGGELPLPSTPPSLAGLSDFGSGAPSEGAAPHLLSGPTQGRQGIGNRIPPSLAALLKSRVY